MAILNHLLTGRDISTSSILCRLDFADSSDLLQLVHVTPLSSSGILLLKSALPFLWLRLQTWEGEGFLICYAIFWLLPSPFGVHSLLPHLIHSILSVLVAQVCVAQMLVTSTLTGVVRPASSLDWWAAGLLPFHNRLYLVFCQRGLLTNTAIFVMKNVPSTNCRVRSSMKQVYFATLFYVVHQGDI